MSTHQDDVTEARLAAALKEEAERGTPVYSELLHARIMRRIGMAGAVGGRGTDRARRWVWYATAAAAVIVLGLWAWNSEFWQSGGGGATNPGNRVVAGGSLVPPVGELLGRTVAMAQERLDAELAEGQLAYLDQDAKRLARFVVDQIAVVPSRP